MDDAQGTTTPLEGATKPILGEEEPTVYKTEEDFQKAVSKGLESVTKQLSLRDAEVRATKAEADRLQGDYDGIVADLAELRRQHEDLVTQQFADDPEARQAYIDRRAIADEKRKLLKDKEEAERKLYEAELKSWAGELALESIELRAKYQVPQEVLDTCVTVEQMRTVAKAFPEVKSEAKEPKFDAATSSAAGLDLSAMTPRQLIEHGIAKSRKK